MKLLELPLFSRTDDGSGILPAAARALGFPMPEDVLEQFILDHGLNHEFQSRYGQLDLHALTWSLEMLPSQLIVGCTSKFETYVSEIAQRHATALTVEEAIYHQDAIESWEQRGTWKRAPILFREVLPAPDQHHLVEGHTRVGALTGFLRNACSPVRIASEHSCWVGRPAAPAVECDWRAVRRQYPLSFKRWIYDAIGSEDQRADLASALLEAEHRNRYKFCVGDDFEDVVKLTERVPILGVDVGTLHAMRLQWEAAVDP